MTKLYKKLWCLMRSQMRSQKAYTALFKKYQEDWQRFGFNA
jgi:hypothetical protein